MGNDVIQRHRDIYSIALWGEGYYDIDANGHVIVYPTRNKADGSVDLYFGPKAPAGKDANWIETVPGKGWFTIFRLYGPLDPWFDKSWRLGEIELVK